MFASSACCWKLLLGVIIFQALVQTAAGNTSSCGCTDVSPDLDFSCAEQQQWGKCESSWMVEQQFCEVTCGRCSCDQVKATEVQVTVPRVSDAVDMSQLSEDAYAKLEQLMSQVLGVPTMEENEEQTAQDLDQDYLLNQLRLASESYNDTVQNDTLQQGILDPEVPQVRVRLQDDEPQEEEPQQIVQSIQVELGLIDLQANDTDGGVLSVTASDAFEANQSQEYSTPAMEDSPQEPLPLSSPPAAEAVSEYKALVTVSNGVYEASTPEVVRDFFVMTDSVDIPIETQANDSVPVVTQDKQCTPIQELLDRTPGLQQFSKLLQMFNYNISDQGDGFTVFAPMDQAIARFLAGHDLNLSDLDDFDPAQLGPLSSKLQPIIKYHIVDTEIRSDTIEFLKILKLDTRFQGKTLRARTVDNPQVPFEMVDEEGNKCNVIIPDMETCEGVVHMVACMLVPDL